MEKRLIGRKLYLKWGENMYIAIEKIPDGRKKNIELELMNQDGKDFVKMCLCNVFECEDGTTHEECLGIPAGKNPGFDIERVFVDQSFWQTPGEANSSQH